MRIEVNYYKVLELEPSASVEQIKRAYQSLALRYHPDHNPNDSQAEGRFRDVQQAYRTLANPQTRAHYDALGRLAAKSADSESVRRAALRLGRLFTESDKKHAPDDSDIFITLRVAQTQRHTPHKQNVFYSRRVSCECKSSTNATSDGGCERCGGTGAHYVSERRDIMVPANVAKGAFFSVGDAGHRILGRTGTLHVQVQYFDDRRAG